MRKLLVLLSLVLFGCNTQKMAEVAEVVELGNAVPNFSLTGHDGNKYSLSDFADKVVVLEWLNHGCPFVKKHYNSGNMQKLQKKLTDKGVVWISIISSAKGKQGHSTVEQAAENRTKTESNATVVLIDESGDIGLQFGAKTTPHMFVLNKGGVLAYEGAIDDKPSTELSTVNGARNYVAEAADALLAGKEVAVPRTKPYGCSVKY